MRLRTANVLLLLVGLFFAVLGIDFHVNRFSAGPNDADGYALIFGTIYLLLGLWCIFGAIRNLRNLPGIRQASVRPSESLVRWHLRILVVAVVCEVFAAIAYSRDLIPSGFKIVHWVMIATFAAIPVIVIVAMALRGRQS
jgi:hypothetical protein